MPGDLFLGIDLGTSSLKLLAITAAGALAGEAEAGYGIDTPLPGWAEQQPATWWAALLAACAELWASGVQPQQIAAIGLSGQMHGAVVLDAQGSPLRPCIIWADQRSASELPTLEAAIPRAELIAISGNAPNTSFTASRLLWLRRHEPEVFARMAKVLLPKDYLRLCLSGDYASDVSDASATLLSDLARRDWSPTILQALGLRRELLPTVVESQVVTGVVSAEAARLTGLVAGTPIVAGGGDTECAALGLGLAAADSPLLAAVGTAGQVFAVSEQPLIDPQGRLHSLCHVVPGRWHLMGAILGGGLSLRWLRNVLLGADLAADAPPDAQPTFDELLAEAAQSSVGANQVLFLPYLLGARTPYMDSQARALFFGLRHDHRRGDLVRAVLEGVVFALCAGLDVLRELKLAPAEARLAGAVARSPLWSQICADVFALPCASGVTERGSAYGAALLASVGVGALPSAEAAAALAAEVGSLTLPDAAASARYAQFYARYSALYPLLRAEFAALAAL